MMGEAGKRMSDMETSEGAAVNISVYLRWQARRFSSLVPYTAL